MRHLGKDFYRNFSSDEIQSLLEGFRINYLNRE